MTQLDSKFIGHFGKKLGLAQLDNNVLHYLANEVTNKLELGQVSSGSEWLSHLGKKLGLAQEESEYLGNIGKKVGLA